MNQHQLENAILGSLMLNPSAWDRAGHRLRLDHFVHGDNSLIFQAIQELQSQGIPSDAVAVVTRLEQQGRLVDDGDHVEHIARQAISAAAIEHHVEMLLDVGLARSIKNMAGRMINLDGSGREQLIQVEAMVASLERAGQGGPERASAGLKAWTESLQVRYEGGEAVGLPTGWADVDRRLLGMRPGDFIVIAGRPSMGKSAALLNILSHNAQRGTPCLLYSLEMQTDSILDRLASSLGGVRFENVRTPSRMDDLDWPRVTSALSILNGLPLWIDDQAALTIQEIHARARQIQRQHGLGLVGIDYLQLVETEGRHYNRETHVAEVSRQIKRMAKDLNVPVIVLAQPNRQCENRPDKRPHMGDLRESGQIENDADAIAFLYRDEVYNPDSPRRGSCELIWRKLRNGSPGTDYLVWLGHLQRFESMARELYPQAETEPAVAGPYED